MLVCMYGLFIIEGKIKKRKNVKKNCTKFTVKCTKNVQNLQ